MESLQSNMSEEEMMAALSGLHLGNARGNEGNAGGSKCWRVIQNVPFSVIGVKHLELTKNSSQCLKISFPYHHGSKQCDIEILNYAQFHELRSERSE